MRAKDFLPENKKNFAGLSDDTVHALPNGSHYPQMDNAYELYRFGVSMASNPGATNQSTNSVGETPIIFAYSSGDEDIIKDTEKVHKMKGRKIGPRDSHELHDTNKTSPVAKIKKNKYGI